MDITTSHSAEQEVLRSEQFALDGGYALYNLCFLYERQGLELAQQQPALSRVVTDMIRQFREGTRPSYFDRDREQKVALTTHDAQLVQLDTYTASPQQLTGLYSWKPGVEDLLPSWAVASLPDMYRASPTRALMTGIVAAGVKFATSVYPHKVYTHRPKMAQYNELVFGEACKVALPENLQTRYPLSRIQDIDPANFPNIKRWLARTGGIFNSKK